MTKTAPTHWRKATHSNPNDSCVEVGRLDGGAAVRDTKYRDLGYVTANRAQWNAFLHAVKTDKFTG